MENKEFIIIPAIKFTQPIGEIYLSVINFDDLREISYADVRRLNSENNQREVESYIGIQRPLSPNRVKEIESYVNLVDATFPTSVILHIEKLDDIQFTEDKDNRGVLKIAYRKDVAKVLDGQHRIEGLGAYKGDPSSFQINVTIFVGMDLEDQAITFATINKTQVKVNQSLVADLFEFAKSRSPQKSAHNIVRALDKKEGGPFYGKIKVLGTANDNEKETITQATFVQTIIDYISGKDKRKMMEDRDLYRRGKKPEKAVGKDLENLFFRNMFISDKDEDIARIINNYFTAVSEKWPEAWKKVQTNMILNKSTGFIALMRFLKDAYLSFKKTGGVISTEEFKQIFNNIDLQDSNFTRDEYIPGSSGQKKLYEQLKEKSGF